MGVVRLTSLQEYVLLAESFMSYFPCSQIPLKSRRKVCNSCILVMFYGSECWALTTGYLQRLQQNEHAMIHWISKVKIRDKISSDSLMNDLCLKNLDIKSLRLVWSCLSQRQLDKKDAHNMK